MMATDIISIYPDLIQELLLDSADLKRGQNLDLNCDPDLNPAVFVYMCELELKSRENTFYMKPR